MDMSQVETGPSPISMHLAILLASIPMHWVKSIIPGMCKIQECECELVPCPECFGIESLRFLESHRGKCIDFAMGFGKNKKSPCVQLINVQLYYHI